MAGGASGGSSGSAGGAAAASGSAGGAAAAQAGAQTSGGGGAPASGATSANGSPPAGLTTDWTSSFNDGDKGFVTNKGWKAPTDVLESYRNLEKLVGAPPEQVIKLPKADDPQGWDSVFTRLGRPANPEGYKLEVPKEGGSPEFAKWASEQFFKAGLSEQQGQGIVKQWNEYQASQFQAQKDAYTAKTAVETSTLKKEWGAAYDQNLAAAARAARTFGVDPKAIGAMEASIGLAATMKFFQSIGSKLGDASYVAGSQPGGNGPLTPAQAKDRISTLKADNQWSKRFLEGSTKEKLEMEMLHKYAFPDG